MNEKHVPKTKGNKDRLPLPPAAATKSVTIPKEFNTILIHPIRNKHIRIMPATVVAVGTEHEFFAVG